MQAQHTAAAKAALKAAMAMAEEAQTAAKEAESVASAKQYNAAHLSSKNVYGDGHVFITFDDFNFSAKSLD